MQRLEFTKAYTEALLTLKPHQRRKIVFLDDAVGSVLSEDIIAQKNLPSFDNSAMDGFAFDIQDAGKRVKINSTIFAGDTPTALLQSGECYKIMTGAKVPNDANTIAPFEMCSDATKDTVTLPKEIQKGANLRKKGEETTIGEILLPKGTLLGFSEVALLASQGISAVTVFDPLKIAIISSGNELKEPWEVASEDEIYNANAFGIQALLKSFGFSASYLGSIPDSLEATIDFIANLEHYDVLITTGGISAGEADFLYQAFIKNGLTTLFHGVAIKPGHPTMLGIMKDSFIAALPGNPLTTLLMAHTFVLPALFKLQGANAFHHSATFAKLSMDLALKPNRVNLILGSVKNGEFIPTRDGKVGSGMLLPLCESSALAYFEKISIKKGEMIKVVMLNDPTRSALFELLNS